VPSDHRVNPRNIISCSELLSRMDRLDFVIVSDLASEGTYRRAQFGSLRKVVESDTSSGVKNSVFMLLVRRTRPLGVLHRHHGRRWTISDVSRVPLAQPAMHLIIRRELPLTLQQCHTRLDYAFRAYTSEQREQHRALSSVTCGGVNHASWISYAPRTSSRTELSGLGAGRHTAPKENAFLGLSGCVRAVMLATSVRKEHS
jgi:hypothetical protein